MLEKILESPLNSKKIKPVSPKGNQPWWFSGRTNAEAEALMLGPPDVKSRLIGKDLDAGEYWRQKKRGSRGWDDQIPSLTWWTWIWATSKGWWWIEKPGRLQSMGSQRVEDNSVTEQQQKTNVEENTLRMWAVKHLSTGSAAMLWATVTWSCSQSNGWGLCQVLPTQSFWKS